MSATPASLRDGFPLLAATPQLHYLDSAATAQIHRLALDAVVRHETTRRANVSRGTYRLAEAADLAYEQARQTAARFLNVYSADEVIFTSGATASLNLVAHAFGGTLKAGDRVVISVAEHHSNFVPWQMLRERTGIELAPPEALGLSGWAERLGRDTPAFWSRWVSEGLLRLAPRAESRILIAGHPPAGVVVELCRDLLAAGLVPEPGHSLVRWVRRQKTSQELQEIRRVAGAVGEAFRGVALLLADASESAGQLWSGGRPLSAGVLRGVIAEALSRQQLEQPKGNIVACGRDGGVPHNQGDDERILRVGESIVVDLFPHTHHTEVVTRFDRAG